MRGMMMTMGRAVGLVVGLCRRWLGGRVEEEGVC
jgi:hypothetical protein